MYETEANRRKDAHEAISAEVLQRLYEARATVIERTVLPWSEHCTECVWPTCYSSCDLYSAREDGRCRRFVDGMVRVDCPEALNRYLLKITFKRWGKLWTPGNVKLRSLREALALERRDYRIGTILTQLPAPAPIKSFVSGKRYSLKKRLAYSAAPSSTGPTCLLLECINPGAIPVDVSLCIRSTVKNIEMPFQKLIQLHSGFSRERVSVSEIENVIDLNLPFNIELIPNHQESSVTLLFGLMEFVRERQLEEATQAHDWRATEKVKCVVWDLDNTLWDGTLIEDEPETLILKPGIKRIIEELDRRGILQSVSSKNNEEDALAVLNRLKLAEFFLAPQISWAPKSAGIQEIARRLNIGIESILFVDDSEFELLQVGRTLPGVRTIHAEHCRDIVNLEECNVPVSAESRERRQMYVVEAERQHVAARFSEDYTAFLRQCEIQVNIRSLNIENLDRVHELTQRTNQMNFSGNRYDKEVLKNVLSTHYLDTFVLDVRDRFGTYGVVGFSIVDRRVPIMTDLMFSCRIQSKHVEHAFLAYLIRKYVAEVGKDFQANYRKTPRNQPSGNVFFDIGMEEVDSANGLARLVYRKEHPVSDDDIVHITVEDSVPPE